MNTHRCWIVGLLLLRMATSVHAASASELLRDAHFAYTTALLGTAGDDCEGISSSLRNAMKRIERLDSACTQVVKPASPQAFLGAACVDWVGGEAAPVFCYSHYRECAPITELWYATANLHRREVPACWARKDRSENRDEIARALQDDLAFYGNLREVTSHLHVGGDVESRIADEAMMALERHHRRLLEELASVLRALQEY